MQHQIDKLQCKFKIHDRDLQHTLERYILKIYDYQLVNAINSALNRIPINLEIDTVELNLPPINLSHLSTKYISHVEKALSDFLQEYLKTYKINTKQVVDTGSKSPSQKLIKYIDKGYFDTLNTQNFKKVWQSTINRSPSFLIEELSKLTDFTKIQRLVNHLYERDLWTLVKKIQPSTTAFKAYHQIILESLKLSIITSNRSVEASKFFWGNFIYVLLSKKQHPQQEIILEHFKLTLKESKCSNEFKLLFNLDRYKYYQFIKPLKQYCLHFFFKDDRTSVGNMVSLLENKHTSENPIFLRQLLDTHSNELQYIFERIPPKKQEILLFNASSVFKQQLLERNAPSIFNSYKNIVVQISSRSDQKLFEKLFLSYALQYVSLNSEQKQKGSFTTDFLKYLQSTSSINLTKRELFTEHLLKKNTYLTKRNQLPHYRKLPQVRPTKHLKETNYKFGTSSKAIYSFGRPSKLTQGKPIRHSKETKFNYNTSSGVTYPFSGTNKKQPTATSKRASKIRLALDFLLNGSIPIDYGTISAAEIDMILKDLFQQNNILKWKQKYIDGSSQGNGIFSSVIENYLTQETKRVAYFLQLASWYPLKKRELYFFKKGTKKKQAKQSQFANSLSTHLSIPNIDTVISYLEPENTNLIIHFVATTVYVIKKESLTTKLEDFERAVYGFVLAFLLSESGYSFHKKRFIQNQVQRISRYFEIDIQRTLQIFLDCLEPLVFLGKTKELFEILKELHRDAVPSNPNNQTTDYEKQTDKSFGNTSEKANQIAYKKQWLERLLFFLESGYLKKAYHKEDFKWLMNHIPLTTTVTFESLNAFLKEQPTVINFVKSIQKKNIDFSITTLSRLLVEKEQEFPLLQNSNSKLIQEILDRTFRISNWQEVLIHFLIHKQLPNAVSTEIVYDFIADIPIQNISYQNIYSILKNESLIRDFILSSISVERKLNLDNITRKVLLLLQSNKRHLEIQQQIEWVTALIYYLEHKKLPNGIRKTEFDDLLRQVCGQQITYDKIYQLLHRHKAIHQWIKNNETLSLNGSISISRLTSFVEQWVNSGTEIPSPFIGTKTHSQQVSLEITEWVHILIQYLKTDQLPSNFSKLSLRRFFQDTSFRKLNYREVYNILINEKAVQKFLKTEAAYRKNLDINNLTSFVLRVLKTNQVVSKVSIEKEIQIPELKTWIKTLIHFLEKQRLPSYTNKQRFLEFIKTIPIRYITYDTIYTILQKQQAIRQFLKSNVAQEKKIDLKRLSLFVFKSIKSNYSDNQILSTDRSIDAYIHTTSKSKEKHWISIFLFYIEQQEIPWWSDYSSISELLKKAQLNQRQKSELLFYFKRNLNTTYLWYSLDEISSSPEFFNFFFQLLEVTTSQQKLIRSLATIFTVKNGANLQLFQKHFGFSPKSYLFWKVSISIKHQYPSSTFNNIEFFIKQLSEAYSVHKEVFAKSLSKILLETKIEVPSTLIEYQKSLEKDLQTSSWKTLSSEVILTLKEQIFDYSSTKESPTETKKWILKLLKQNTLEFLSVLQKTIQQKRYSITQLTLLLESWSALLFPGQKPVVIVIFKELALLQEKYSKWNHSNILELYAIFLWKTKLKFNKIDLNSFLESFLYTLAQKQHLSLSKFYENYLDLEDLKPLQVPLLKQFLIFNSASTSSNKAFLEALKKETKKTSIPEELIIDEPILVPYAGIVLLWKFFIPLFKHFDLWDNEEEKYKSEELKNKAIIVLLFLAKGSCDFEDEHELIVMKLLSGIPLDHLTQPITLTESEQQLAEGLILSVIPRWKQLGTCSVEGFRHTFLKRSALLTIEEGKEGEGKTLISFETTTTGVDMLLDFLPWTIGTIRLPWLERDIVTNWRDK